MEQKYFYRIINHKTNKPVTTKLFTFDDLTEYRLIRYTKGRRYYSTKENRHITGERRLLDIVEFKLVETNVSVPVTDNMDFTKLLMETFRKE